MGKVAAKFYDKRSNVIVSGLKQWLYDELRTGVSAVVGREPGQEPMATPGARRRICDALFELLNVTLAGKPAALALLHFDVQVRAAGDEIRRAAGYKGIAVIFLTPVPSGLKTLIRGYPDDTRLGIIDMSRVDGLELLKVRTPEAAAFAVLSLVAPRNLWVRGIVEILNDLATHEEWIFRTETVYGFALLRKDYLEIFMEKKSNARPPAPNAKRNSNLFSARFTKSAKSKGAKRESKKAAKKAVIKSASKLLIKMRSNGVDVDFIAEITGLSVDVVSGL